MITSIIGSAIQALTRARIASMSSVTMLRSATKWPAATMRCTSSAPDLSSLTIARVGNRQHRDLERHEFLVLVDPGM